MKKESKYNDLIQWHNAIESFDYNLTIDWALELMNKGIISDNVLMLASFSKPVESYEIKPYVSAVLSDLNLEEKYGVFSTIAKAHFHLNEILINSSLRKNLNELYKLYNRIDHEHGLTVFYLIYHAWAQLEYEEENYYYPEADLSNIEQILKEQAKLWIDEYVNCNS